MMAQLFRNGCKNRQIRRARGLPKRADTPPYRLLYERFLTPELVIVQVASYNELLKHDGIITLLLKRNGGGWLAEEVNVQAIEGLPTVPGETVVFPPSSAPKQSPISVSAKGLPIGPVRAARGCGSPSATMEARGRRSNSGGPRAHSGVRPDRCDG
jgi:hypothetical protein